MSEENKVQVHTQGKPWKNVGVFDSYETASNQVMHLIAVAPTYDYKIKRCGPMGSQFSIKCRLNPKLDEAEQTLMKKKKASDKKKSKK
tara:strand:+ start:134 stop:397 length:264 start_codon:yes stop_codon:yes gene_type:complete